MTKKDYFLLDFREIFAKNTKFLGQNTSLKSFEVALMVVGNGLLANAFKNTSFCKKQNNENLDNTLLENCVVFASGVSDSTCKENAAFQRERDLLEKMATNFLNNENQKVFVYFSSCDLAVFEDQFEIKNNLYFQHKKSMECLCRELLGERALILRLPIVLGQNKSSNSLINFFTQKIKNGEKVPIFRHSRRFLIAPKDIIRLCIFLLSEHILARRARDFAQEFGFLNLISLCDFPALNIAQEIANVLNLPLKYELLEKGFAPNLAQMPQYEEICELCGVEFSSDFNENLKYLKRNLSEIFV